MRDHLERVAAMADWREDSEVTSRESLRMFGDEGRESRAEILRAVATTRCAVCVARWLQRAYPMPEEQPVMNQTADGGRSYGAMFALFVDIEFVDPCCDVG